MVEVFITTGVRTPGAFSSVEIEILKRLAAGLQTKELASALERSAAAIEHHIRMMCAKTGSATRAQLVANAIAIGAITVSAQ